MHRQEWKYTDGHTWAYCVQCFQCPVFLLVHSVNAPSSKNTWERLQKSWCTSCQYWHHVRRNMVVESKCLVDDKKLIINSRIAYQVVLSLKVIIGNKPAKYSLIQHISSIHVVSAWQPPHSGDGTIQGERECSARFFEYIVNAQHPKQIPHETVKVSFTHSFMQQRKQREVNWPREVEYTPTHAWA